MVHSRPFSLGQQMRTRIKICGITNIDDVRVAVEAGVDALGFNLYSGSSRYIDVDTARYLVSELPPFVASVGLFVNESADNVAKICDQVDFDYLQFHGDETADFCSQFSKRYIKAMRVKNADTLLVDCDVYSTSSAVMLDAYVADEFGGTGSVINWRELPVFERPVILAGGLNVHNIIQAIALVKPYAVDVSSGVESRKGLKDAGKIRDFISAVAAADRSSLKND